MSSGDKLTSKPQKTYSGRRFSVAQSHQQKKQGMRNTFYKHIRTKKMTCSAKEATPDDRQGFLGFLVRMGDSGEVYEIVSYTV
jgi:hypothetical protein